MEMVNFFIASLDRVEEEHESGEDAWMDEQMEVDNDSGQEDE